MDISYWRYRLVPLRALNARSDGGAREGALIRVGDGFADVHPWPELGDLPLDAQLQMLVSGTPTPLLAASLECAAVDGAARRAGRSLFEGLEIPISHWPAVAGEPPDEFETVKVKCGPAFTAETLEPFAGRRLRLDFNETLTVDEFLRLAPTLPENVEFVEDPTPYVAADWLRMRETTGLRLALDRGVGSAGVDVRVQKPALSFEPPGVGRVVVTSYMDHTIGQMWAAYFAARHARSIDPVAGLFTHVVYQDDAFIERIESRGPRLLPPDGTGLGFDDLLERIPWRRLQ